MKNNKKNTNNKQSKLSQLSPDSKLLPAELTIVVGAEAPSSCPHCRGEVKKG